MLIEQANIFNPWYKIENESEQANIFKLLALDMAAMGPLSLRS